MEITLKLSKTQGALLTALSRGVAVKTPLQETAIRILNEGMRSKAKRRRINSEAVLAVVLVEAVKTQKGKGAVKFELNLSESDHRYLLEASSHDRKLRSLQSFPRDCLIEGLNRHAAKDLDQRKVAIATLVGPGSKRREP